MKHGNVHAILPPIEPTCPATGITPDATSTKAMKDTFVAQMEALPDVSAMRDDFVTRVVTSPVVRAASDDLVALILASPLVRAASDDFVTCSAIDYAWSLYPTSAAFTPEGVHADEVFGSTVLMFLYRMYPEDNAKLELS